MPTPIAMDGNIMTKMLAMKALLCKIYDNLDAYVEKTAYEIKLMEEIKPFISPSQE